MEELDSTKTCINCGAEGTEKYCSQCGQRLEIKRITFKEGWHDFWARIYGFDGMFPRTFRDLTVRPGAAAREYIAGNRAKYYGPVGYFFLMITLLLLWLSILDLSFEELVKNTQARYQGKQEQNKVAEWVVNFVLDNLKLVLFFIVPFQAFSARYIFFRKSGFNFMEHMVLPFFVGGHLMWITIALFTYRKITGDLPATVASLITPLFFGYAYLSFMPDQSKIKTFLRGIGVYFGGQLLFVTLLVVLAIVIIPLLYYFNSEAYELIRPSNNR
jgi:phage shock protein PspC (stress-responsive transcriptional regulator)